MTATFLRSDGDAGVIDTLRVARGLLQRANPQTAGLWPRAAALLIRQCLETALDEFWAGRGLSFEARSGRRQQLICLRAYLAGQPDLARDLGHAWGTLSRACHHHPYELAPIAGELGGPLSAVEAFVRINALQGTAGA